MDIWRNCEDTEEYLGSAVGYDRVHDCVIVKEGGFRSKSRELETWEFILEQYSRYEGNRIIFDIRDSIYPAAGPEIEAAFKDMATSLPPSHVGFLTDNRQPDIVRLSKEAIEAAGHTCCVAEDLEKIFQAFARR